MAITIESHPAMAKLQMAAKITLRDFLRESKQTIEDLDRKHDWRITVDYHKYSLFAEPIDEFVARLVENEISSGVRVIPRGPFIINIESRTQPDSHWYTTMNRCVFYNLTDPRLRCEK